MWKRPAGRLRRAAEIGRNIVRFCPSERIAEILSAPASAITRLTCEGLSSLFATTVNPFGLASPVSCLAGARRRQHSRSPPRRRLARTTESIRPFDAGRRRSRNDSAGCRASWQRRKSVCSSVPRLRRRMPSAPGEHAGSLRKSLCPNDSQRNTFDCPGHFFRHQVPRRPTLTDDGPPDSGRRSSRPNTVRRLSQASLPAC